MMKQTIYITILLLTIACTQAAAEEFPFVELKGKIRDAMVPIVALSADAKRVATAEGEIMRIWDAETGAELEKIKVWDLNQGAENLRKADFIAFSPDGKKIASADADKIARIREIGTDKEPVELKGHTEPILSFAFSPDGTKIVTASGDTTARVWDAESGKELKKLAGHTEAVWSAAFLPEAGKIVTASRDGSVINWDVETGKELQKWEECVGFAVKSTGLSPDGKKHTIVWLPAEPINNNKLEHRVSIVDIDARGERGKQLEGMMDNANSIGFRTFIFSPDGKRIVSFAKPRDIFQQLPQQIRFDFFRFFYNEETTTSVYDVESGKKLLEWGGRTAWVPSAAFSADGKMIATIFASETNGIWSVRVWDLEKMMLPTRPAVSDF